MAKARHAKITAGWREWVSLPELGGARIKAKLDTGARTSAIHAWNIELEEREDEAWLSFDLHPLQRDNRRVIPCRARLLETRTITNTGGHKERRYIIRTPLTLGNATWPIELSLANRDEMGFRMLIGRTAIRGRLVVDPGRSFLLGPKPPGGHRAHSQPRQAGTTT